jgi:hypothetical protein
MAVDGIMEDAGMGGPMGGFGPAPDEKISMWLEGLYAKGAAIGRLQLCQRVMGSQTPVGEWFGEELEGQEPMQLAGNIYAAAQEDVQHASGVTSYTVQAYRSADDTVFFSRLMFRLAPEDLNAAMDTEPGHLAEGHMAQAHRHAEVYMRMVVGMASDSMRVLREQNRDLAAQAMNGMKLQLQTIELHQRLMDRKMMRKIYFRKMEQRERRKEQVVNYLMQFLPDAMGKLGLAPGGMKQALEDMAVMQAVVGRLPKEQIESVAGMLPDDKARDAFGRFAIESRKKVEEADIKAAAKGGGPKQLPAAGQTTQQPQQKQPSPSKPPPPQSIALTLTDKDVDRLEAVTLFFAEFLAMKKDHSALHENVRPIIEAACNAIRTAKGQGRDLTADEAQTVQAMQSFVIATLCESSDDEIKKLGEHPQIRPAAMKKLRNLRASLLRNSSVSKWLQQQRAARQEAQAQQANP